MVNEKLQKYKYISRYKKLIELVDKLNVDLKGIEKQDFLVIVETVRSQKLAANINKSVDYKSLKLFDNSSKKYSELNEFYLKNANLDWSGGTTGYFIKKELFQSVFSDPLKIEISNNFLKINTINGFHFYDLNNEGLQKKDEPVMLSIDDLLNSNKKVVAMFGRGAYMLYVQEKIASTGIFGIPQLPTDRKIEYC